jgi:thiosulfate reductase cytochrome b subunit
MISKATQRTIFRWIHLVLAIPIIGYVYSLFEELPNYAPVVRFIAIPMLVLTGLWMWKGHVLRRLTDNLKLKKSALTSWRFTELGR